MQKKCEKKLAILNVIKEQNDYVSSGKITRLLAIGGADISERTVRLYLKELDEEGLTTPNGKKGRMITQDGLAELQAAKVVQKPGYLSAKIDQMIYRMNLTCR